MQKSDQELDEIYEMSVIVETTKGTFTVDLYIDQRPKVCKNFLKLCKVKFFNLNLFHSVQSNFIAQTGGGLDPNNPEIGAKTGESVYRRLYGDQATYFEGDLAPKIKHTKAGQISMVTVGDNMFGSQFFLTLDENLDYLDGQGHCVFGEVVEGLDEVVQVFNETICDSSHRPYQDIRITHMVILEDPFEDPKGLEIPPKSPEITQELLKSSRIGADEELNDYEGMEDEQIVEMIAEKEAKAQATVLEMLGDLPDADVAPPENVLFVCKLNPVTTDDDLEIIFSRFGKVKSCEVIRDHKTQDSLQYAFVEFEEQKACEQAYFKMDNVLIDDRRIHVDFSQSVSKYRWKGKGRLEVLDDKKPEKKEYQRRNYNDNRPRDRSRDRKNRRSRSRSRDRKRRRSRSRERRSRSKDKSDRRDRDRKERRSKSRERKERRSRSRDRNGWKSRSRSRDRNGRRSRSRSRDRSDKHRRDRKRSRSREHKTSSSRDHKRHSRR